MEVTILNAHVDRGVTYVAGEIRGVRVSATVPAASLGNRSRAEMQRILAQALRAEYQRLSSAVLDVAGSVTL